MKIKPIKREIAEVSQVSIGEIPLSYISTKDTRYTPNVEISPSFAVSAKKRLEPYQTFLTDKNLFFDGSNKPLNDVALKRQGNTYTYMPKGMSEFTPLHFGVNAYVQRTMTYDASKTYNLKVATIETDASDDLALTKKLMPVFGDAYKRGIAPANVIVNDGNTTPEIMASQSLNDVDVVFIETTDGEDLYGLDLEEIIKKQTNIWISAESFGQTFLKRENNDKSTYATEGHLNECFYSSKRTRLSDYVFNTTGLMPEAFKDYSDRRSFPYEDVMLLKTIGWGTIIVTPKDFLENAVENVRVIYDIMLNLFFNGVFATKTLATWITDKPIDKLASLNTPYRRTHGSIKMQSLLRNDKYDIGTEYQLLRINTMPETVVFVGLNDDGEMLFAKAGGEADPAIPENAVTFMATSGNVLIYEPKEVYSLEVPIDVKCTIQDRKAYVTVSSYKSTTRMVSMDEEQVLPVPDIARGYYLCLVPVESRKEFKLVDKNAYNKEQCGDIAAEVSIDIDYDVSAFDIRQLGGGLPLVCKDDYAMEDIGNVYGRPYRIGSTVIITLPRRCKPYEDKIRDAIDLHIAAGEKAILRFT